VSAGQRWWAMIQPVLQLQIDPTTRRGELLPALPLNELESVCQR
jgi:hypothetical protein